MNTNWSTPRRMGVTVETASPAEVYEVISNACSQDPRRVQASSKRLKEMVEMFGTFDALHDIAAQRTVPLQIRRQAIIQFKNGVHGHWRSRKVLNDEQRSRIRTRCLSFLDEEDDTIAECNEVVTSKVSRQDFPHNWPNLVNDLMSAVDAALQRRYITMIDDPRDALVLRRSLRLLNMVLKELASVKMLNGVKIMSQLVEQLRQVLYDYYSRLASCFSPTQLTTESIGMSRIYYDMLISHLVYKCIVKISIWLWNRLDKLANDQQHMYQHWLETLFLSSAVQLKALAEHRRSLVMTLIQSGTLMDPTVSRAIGILTRHAQVFGKFFRRLQQLGHQRFVSLPMCSDLILFYWSQVVDATASPSNLIADSVESVYPIRFLVQGMVLFKENLAQWAPTRKDGTANPNSLSQEFVEDAVKLLVTRFMPLNPKDLENWMSDPEEWVNCEDKEDDQWQFEIRGCSERVLMQLSAKYPEFVTPLLASTFKQIAVQPAIDIENVIQKEALYCAVGRCALRLQNDIPFEEWVEQTLVSESQSTNPNYPIIKRRIAWTIGKWISDACASPNNPKIWEILLHLLKDRGEGTDAVVRLTAAVALGSCVDTVDFAADIFAPFLPIAISELVKILAEVDTFESKRRIDNSLNTIIEHSGTRITPFITIITEPLPRLWAEAGNDLPYKGSLLVTVTKLVEAVKEQSTILGGIVVPLVRESLLPGVNINLDEDGITLWLAALQNTTTFSSVNGAPGLIDLFPQGMELLASNLDLLAKITNVIESYCLLDGQLILKLFAVDLFRAFHTALKSDAVTLCLKDILIALNLLIQVTPSELWGEALHTSGLFAYILLTLVDGESDTILMTEHISLLARIIMGDRQMFLQLVSATAASKDVTETYLYDGLMDQWWGKFDNMSEPRYRKLAAMGVASLVSTGRPEILHRLPTEIFNLWLDVFGEIRESLDRNAGESSSAITNLQRHWERDPAPRHYYQDTEGTPEYDRRKIIWDRDPVRTIQLSAFVAIHIREVEAACGAEAFQASYLSKADPTVLKQIQEELVRV